MAGEKDRSPEGAPDEATVIAGRVQGSPASRRYQIMKTLGKGGMGVVCLAYDSVLERDVAIKQLHANLTSDRDLMERFRREAKVLAKMTHPGVVQVFDFVDEEGAAWIVMEFVKGRELADYLKEHGALPPDEASALGIKMAEALSYAHSLGIIHRDFKPQNVILSESGSPKIMDFGLARLLQSAHQTTPGMIMGSPAYMSPEQAKGQAADERSDVYALGVVLYKMLTGKSPFEGDIQSVLAQHLSVKPVPLRQVNPAVPEALNKLVLMMLEKDPAKRPQDMSAVIGGLGGRFTAGRAGETIVMERSQEEEIGDIDALIEKRKDLERLFKEKFTKTLTVMFTDLKGSTTIAETEGDFSSRLLIQDHNAIVFPTVAKNNGTLVKTMGDGTLSYFEKSIDALRAAVSIQRDFERYNIDKKPRVPILIRIGLHRGPVIMEKNDIFGDAVNVASRFESTANPAEIYMSESTFNDLPEGCEVPCKFIKTTKLKGKSEVFNVYKAFWNPEELSRELEASAPAEPKKSSQALWIAVAAIILAVIMAFLVPAITKQMKGETEQKRSIKHTTE